MKDPMEMGRAELEQYCRDLQARVERWQKLCARLQGTTVDEMLAKMRVGAIEAAQAATVPSQVPTMHFPMPGVIQFVNQPIE